MWILRWNFKCSLLVNDFPHISHIQIFVPVWDFMCSAREFLWANIFPQVSHWLICRVTWVSGWLAFLCEDKCLVYAKASPQTSHVNGVSIVWIFLCLFTWYERLNVFLHTSQAYGRSSLCLTAWRFKSLLLLHTLPHTSQVNLFTAKPGQFNCFSGRFCSLTSCSTVSVVSELLKLSNSLSDVPLCFVYSRVRSFVDLERREI